MKLLRDKKFLTSLVVSFAIVAAAWIAASALPKPFDDRHVQTSFAFDPGDDIELALNTHHIFVGRVVGFEGTMLRGDSMPWSRFTVAVADHVMGELPARVTVLQEGGWSVEEGRTILVAGDELLEIGRTYLFATRTGGGGEWHTLVPIYGKLPVGDRLERERLIERFGAVAAMIEEERRAIERERLK